MNPIILYDNRFDDAAPVATDTAAGYDVLNIRDGRPYTFWKGASAGAKNIKVNCGAAKTADALSLSAHNLRTAGADVTVEHSPDDITYQVALAIRKADVTRSSSAYTSDGALVSGTIPRYEAGKFGKALMIEEGATNLLSANQASVETDLTGFSPVSSAVLTRVTDRAWHGNASVRVVTPGSVSGEGVLLMYTTAVQGTYLSHGRARGAGSVNIWTRVMYSDLTYTEGSYTAYVLDDTKWHHLISTPVVSDPAKTVLRTETYIRTIAIQGVTFWCDGFMLHVGTSYMRSFQLPGVTRTAEFVSFSAVGVLSPAGGSYAEWVFINDIARRQVAGQYNMIFSMSGLSGVANRLYLAHQETSAIWFIASADDAGAGTSASIADSILPDGWNRVLTTWDASAVKLYVNGVLRATISSPKLPSVFTAVNIGSSPTAYHLNTLHDDVRAWGRVVTAEEAAADAARTTPGPADVDLTGLWSFDDTVLSGLLPADTSVLRTFPAASARYWRLTVTTTTLAAQIGLASISSRLEFPYPPDIPFVPRRRKTITESSRSRNGHLLGVVMSYKEIKIKPKFSLLLRSWVDALYEPFYRDHYSLKKPFFWAWDLSLYPGMVYLVVAEGEPDDALPVSMGAYYDAVELSMEGIEE